MRCAQLSPSLRLAYPFVQVTIGRVHTGLTAWGVRVWTCLTDIWAQTLDSLAHLLVGLTLREPAVGHAGSTPQQHVSSAACPDGDGTALREGIESSLGDGMELAVVADDRLTPEQAQHLDLLLDGTTACVEVHAERLVLHRVPAYPYAETQLATGEYIHLRCLLGDERCLSLGADDDGRDQLQVSQCRKVTEEHERLLETILLGISPPTRAGWRSGPQDVGKNGQVLVA